MNQKKLMPLRYPHGAKNAVRPGPPPPLKLWDVVEGWIVYFLDEASNTALLVAPSKERLLDRYSYRYELIPGIEPQVQPDRDDPYTGKHNTEFLKQTGTDGTPYSPLAKTIANKGGFLPNTQELTQLLQSDLDHIDSLDTSGGTYTFAEIKRRAYNGQGNGVISSSQCGTKSCLARFGHNPYMVRIYPKDGMGFGVGIRELPIVGGE